MLTVHPHQQEQEALLTVARWWQRADWDRVAVSVIAGFYLWLSATLLLAPQGQILTQGSAAAFGLMPPDVWAIGFFVGGVAAASVAWHVTGARQAIAWFMVFPAQTVWLGASILAVVQGGGSAIGVVLWSVILSFTVLTAVRLAVAYTSGKR